MRSVEEEKRRAEEVLRMRSVEQEKCRAGEVSRMRKSEVINQIQRVGLLPVIRFETSAAARQAVAALYAGGINIFEITLTVPGALEVIAELKQRWADELLVGAGTVLSAAAAESCLRAGAEFIVSPLFDAGIVELCQRHEVTVLAGAMTLTEIWTAWRAGADLVKVYPIESLGGVGYLKAVKTVLPEEVLLVPTGGVKRETAGAYLQAGAAAVGIGGELAKVEWVAMGRFDEITAAAQNLIRMLGPAERRR